MSTVPPPLPDTALAPTPVDEALAGFSESNLSFRLVRGLFGVLPGAPKLTPYSRLSDVGAVTPAALEFAQGKQARRALQVAHAIDLGDAGISVYTGVTTVISYFLGRKNDEARTFDNDREQSADAALKGLAIAYLAHLLFEGTATEKARKLWDTDAGKALVWYFGAVEVALPFMDDALKGGGNVVGNLVDRFGGAERLETAVGDADAAEGAAGVFSAMTQTVNSVVAAAADRTGPIVETCQEYLPSTMVTADQVAGTAAAAADALPVYRMLVARLVAEAAIQRG